MSNPPIFVQVAHSRQHNMMVNQALSVLTPLVAMGSANAWCSEFNDYAYYINRPKGHMPQRSQQWGWLSGCCILWRSVDKKHPPAPSPNHLTIPLNPAGKSLGVPNKEINKRVLATPYVGFNCSQITAPRQVSCTPGISAGTSYILPLWAQLGVPIPSVLDMGCFPIP